MTYGMAKYNDIQIHGAKAPVKRSSKMRKWQRGKLWFVVFGVLLPLGMLSGVSRAAKTKDNAKAQTKINPKDDAEMVYVPAGAFTMGSSDADMYADDDEKPAHQVTLDGYWIYKNEVTVGQYKKFCAATGHKMPKAPQGGWTNTHPIVNVSWDDAQAYCAWAGVKLPTEAQWEKAARGTDGRIYPWGNVWDTDKANAYGAYGDQTTPVGSFPKGASPYGCLDMAGNVWEWCQDWYGSDYYASSPTSNPTGPVSGQNRVLRGGSWYDNSNRCRSANRNSDDPSGRYPDSGFRCVVPGR
jgi:serine/threonine-protein kinase